MISRRQTDRRVRTCVEGPPPAKNERAVDEIHPRVRRATGEIIPDNRRRQTNPAESTDPPAVASSSFRVHKFGVISERKFIVIRIARRQTDRAPDRLRLLSTSRSASFPSSSSDMGERRRETGNDGWTIKAMMI